MFTRNIPFCSSQLQDSTVPKENHPLDSISRPKKKKNNNNNKKKILSNEHIFLKTIFV